MERNQGHCNKRNETANSIGTLRAQDQIARCLFAQITSCTSDFVILIRNTPHFLISVTLSLYPP